jgi:hypothetical protein
LSLGLAIEWLDTMFLRVTNELTEHEPPNLDQKL